MKTYQVAPPTFRVSKNNLLAYLETEILPRYSVLDVGHNQNHIYQVLKNAYELDDKLGNKVDSNLLTTAVVYHDLGVLAPTKEGRKKHHEVSAEVARNDRQLRDFFTENEIEQIAVACFEHRASVVVERKTLLSKIVADADTVDSINFERIMAYTYEWVPGGSRQDRLQHMFDHFHKKHGKGNGYAGFDLPEAEEMVRARRELLWEISESFEKFDEYFAKQYDF